MYPILRRHTPLVAAAMLACAAPVAAQRPPSSQPAGPPPSYEPELAAQDLLVRYEAPRLRFRWSLAPEAALEPALVKSMRAEALVAREAAVAALANQPSAGERQFQTEWHERWRLDAETDALLAFSAQRYEFTGGAHGNIVMRGAIWDRATGKRIEFAELFADPAAAKAAIKPAFCKALDAERKERRGGALGQNFADCPDFSAYPILPTGDGRLQSFRVLVPPYEAGPWSEGVYEIALDAAPFVSLMLPKYRAAFTGG